MVLTTLAIFDNMIVAVVASITLIIRLGLYMDAKKTVQSIDITKQFQSAIDKINKYVSKKGGKK